MVEMAVAAVIMGDKADIIAVKLLDVRKPRGFTYTISFCRR